jgi:hypothetical protein
MSSNSIDYMVQRGVRRRNATLVVLLTFRNGVCQGRKRMRRNHTCAFLLRARLHFLGSCSYSRSTRSVTLPP